jgi:hypothetical protein
VARMLLDFKCYAAGSQRKYRQELYRQRLRV